jgi:hypothetical protein
LTWTYTEPKASDGSLRDPVSAACPFLPGDTSIDCAFDVIVSSNLSAGMMVTLDITAVNDAPSSNRTFERHSIGLTSRPTVSLVRPQSGGVAGGTNVVIQGSGFVNGTRVYFGNELLIPNGGIILSQEAISGYAPAAQIAGSVPVTLQSPLGFASWDQKFKYQLPPHITSIVPETGREGEATQVQILGANFSETTIIYLGHTLASAVALSGAKLASDTEIDGVVPPGIGQATVWALDPSDGWTSLPNGFSWIAP